MPIPIQFFSLLIFFSIVSCKKSEDRTCFKSLGKDVVESRPATQFDYIFLHDNINLILTQDSIHSIIVEAPENLINFIKTDNDGNYLTIKNKNKCDFLRSYKYSINVYVSIINLKNIYFTGSGKITSLNTIKAPMISIDFWSASGGLDIALEAGTSYSNLHAGPGDITLTGSAGVSNVYSLGNGFFHLENYTSGYCFVNNSGTGDFFINVEKEMAIGIHSLGSVFYKGNPAKITSEITGEGKLIKL